MNQHGIGADMEQEQADNDDFDAHQRVFSENVTPEQQHYLHKLENIMMVKCEFFGEEAGWFLDI